MKTTVVDAPISPWYGEDELRGWLEGQGFRIASAILSPRDNECNWYAYRRSKLPARACECNSDKPGTQIVVIPHTTSFGDRSHSSVEIEVCGEAGGVWWKLTGYAMSPAEVPERLEFVETALVAAWNALLPNAELSGVGTAVFTDTVEISVLKGNE